MNKFFTEFEHGCVNAECPQVELIVLIAVHTLKLHSISLNSMYTFLRHLSRIPYSKRPNMENKSDNEEPPIDQSLDSNDGQAYQDDVPDESEDSDYAEGESTEEAVPTPAGPSQKKREFQLTSERRLGGYTYNKNKTTKKAM